VTGLSRFVVAPNWLGDSVMAIPFVRALRRAHPEDRLFVAARRGPAAIFRAEGSAEVLDIRGHLFEDSWALRKHRFDEAWLLPNSFRSGLLAFLSGASARIGYDTDGRGRLLTDAVALPPATRHQLRDYDRLLESRGVDPDLDPPRLPIPREAQERADGALARAGLRVADPFVLLAPGAAFAWTKRWPPESFGRLGAALRRSGLACAIGIGPGEADLARQVSAAAETPLPILGEDLGPVELAAALSRARVVVSNDSGPMHLAAAVGTPVVAFFGPTDPGRTAPAGAPFRILDRYVFCSPCFLKECPYAHECMREIEPEVVLQAVKEMIGKRETGNELKTEN
jgi:heptosyltransferase II